MDGDATDLSARARKRAEAAQRREARARERGAILDMVVSGYSYESIAEAVKLSVKSVRRATEKAIEGRRLEGGPHYVRLQVLRLTKALQVVDLNLDEGDLKAVAPMLKVIAELDKYHALLAPPSALGAPAPAPALPPPTPKPASPPPALARPPLALAAPEPAEIGTEKGAQAVEIA
jgi:hypothetical protein